jgi:hypothetical protein
MEQHPRQRTTLEYIPDHVFEDAARRLERDFESSESAGRSQAAEQQADHDFSFPESLLRWSLANFSPFPEVVIDSPSNRTSLIERWSDESSCDSPICHDSLQTSSSALAILSPDEQPDQNALSLHSSAAEVAILRQRVAELEAKALQDARECLSLL